MNRWLGGAREPTESSMLAWITLVIAGLCEVAWAVGMKSTQGFTRLWPSVWVIAAMLMSFVLLARAARTIHPPLAYSAWVGIGVVGVWLVSVTILKEPMRGVQLVFVGLVVAGVIGLKMTAGAGQTAPIAP